MPLRTSRRRSGGRSFRGVVEGERPEAHRRSLVAASLLTPATTMTTHESSSTARPILRMGQCQPGHGDAALFVDRDGVINRRVIDGYVTTVSQLDLLDTIVPVLRRATQAGTPIVIVTNQGAVSRDVLTEEELARIHQHLLAQLETLGITISAIYACPHHPLASRPKDRSCVCRKPAPGLINAAATELSLDRVQSAFIGDQETDRQAAHAAGIPDEGIWVFTAETATAEQVGALETSLARRFGWP